MSLGSSTRFVAPGTFSALDRIPIRWRLAGGSAILTLIILCGFAVAVGALTAQRIHDDFKQEVREAADRLRALLRRRPPRGSASLVVGDLSLNPDTHEVVRGGRTVELTQREFELLEYLMRNERIVVPRQRLLEEVWGYDPFATTNTIEVFVSNLRRKLEAGGEQRLLHTIRGAGYVLRA